MADPCSVCNGHVSQRRTRLKKGGSNSLVVVVRSGFQLLGHESFASLLPRRPIGCCSSSFRSKHTSFASSRTPCRGILIDGIVGYRVAEELQVNLGSRGQESVSASANA